MFRATSRLAITTHHSFNPIKIVTSSRLVNARSVRNLPPIDSKLKTIEKIRSDDFSNLNKLYQVVSNAETRGQLVNSKFTILRKKPSEIALYTPPSSELAIISNETKKSELAIISNETKKSELAVINKSTKQSELAIISNETKKSELAVIRKEIGSEIDEIALSTAEKAKSWKVNIALAALGFVVSSYITEELMNYFSPNDNLKDATLNKALQDLLNNLKNIYDEKLQLMEENKSNLISQAEATMAKVDNFLGSEEIKDQLKEQITLSLNKGLKHLDKHIDILKSEQEKLEKLKVFKDESNLPAKNIKYAVDMFRAVCVANPALGAMICIAAELALDENVTVEEAHQYFDNFFALIDGPSVEVDPTSRKAFEALNLFTLDINSELIGNTVTDQLTKAFPKLLQNKLIKAAFGSLPGTFMKALGKQGTSQALTETDFQESLKKGAFLEKKRQIEEKIEANLDKITSNSDVDAQKILGDFDEMAQMLQKKMDNIQMLDQETSRSFQSTWNKVLNYILDNIDF